jgi:hypothetical protein
VNVEIDEVPRETPEDLPAFVFVRKGNVQVYRRNVELSLIEWIESILPPREISQKWSSSPDRHFTALVPLRRRSEKFGSGPGLALGCNKPGFL